MEVADRDQVVERFGELSVADGLSLDPDPLEDGLVEQAPGARLGQPVGGLEPVGQLERDVETGQHIAVINGQFGLQLLPRNAFASQPFLFLVEQTLGDLVGVVGTEEFAFLRVESAQQFRDAGSFGCNAGVEGGDVVAHVRPDLAAMLRVELDGGVVILDGQFESQRAVMRLRAGALLAAAADEVLIDPAVAVGSRVDQAPVAFAAVQAAPQVVVVAPVALAAGALGIEHLLHGLEGREVDERLVATFVDLARVAQDADVVVVSQQVGQAVGAQCPAGCAPGALAAQPAGFEDRPEFGERVVAAGVQLEGFGDVRSAIGIMRDGADFPAVDDFADVDIADRRAERRTAALGLLGGALLNFQAEVGGVELGDRAHDAVQQQPGRCLVDVLANRHQDGTGLADRHHDRDVVRAVAGQPVDLVHDDVLDVAVGEAGQHSLQRRAVGRCAGFAAFDELRDHGRLEAVGLAQAGGALGGQRVALSVVVLLSLLGRGHPQIDQCLGEGGHVSGRRRHGAHPRAPSRCAAA